MRAEIGGVERLAREMTRRLPALRPDRYCVISPPARLAHRAGHVWEQSLLPLQAHGCALIYSPANLAPFMSDKNVLVLHDLAAFRHPEAYSQAYVRYQSLMLPALARRARLLLTVSQFSRDELAELLPVEPGRIVVIPEGVDERFRPSAPEAVDRARKLYGLERPYVLTVGTMSARKNLAVLDRAATALRQRGVELVLAGSDRGYLRSGSVPVRRLGYVAEEHLPAVYAGALAFVLSSRYEGFGLPCLEAMACGTPVIATRAGALPETVGHAGLLLDPDDGDAFATALLGLVDDPAARERLSEAGRDRAATFSWTRTAELTDRAVEQLLGPGARRAGVHS